MGIETKEQCKRCFHFQVCASVLKNELYIREVMLKEKEPKCKCFVEVVRCKDCIHNVANSKPDPLDGTDYTDIVCRYWMSDGCGAEDFCSRGERRNHGSD